MLAPILVYFILLESHYRKYINLCFLICDSKFLFSLQAQRWVISANVKIIGRIIVHLVFENDLDVHAEIPPQILLTQCIPCLVIGEFPPILCMGESVTSQSMYLGVKNIGKFPSLTLSGRWLTMRVQFDSFDCGRSTSPRLS